MIFYIEQFISNATSLFYTSLIFNIPLDIYSLFSPVIMKNIKKAVIKKFKLYPLT